MENLSAKTRFTGRQFVYLPVCNSTNAVAQELLNKNEATEGCVIAAGQQTAGRGQRGNSWEAAAGQNLTFSVIYKPVFLPAARQFNLNMAVSLAIADHLQQYLPAGFALKWPNDLYFEDKKLGGILIENSISGANLQTAVIGIGLNVNQVFFGHPQAISLKLITGHTFELQPLLEGLLASLENRYLQLQQHPHENRQAEYWSRLLGFGQYRLYESEGGVFEGKIVGTDTYGRLELETAEGLKVFGLKEIRYRFGEG